MIGKNKSVFEVTDTLCNECLFSKNKIVDEERKRDVINDCIMNDTYFSCHKATIKNRDVCCRGFYENIGHKITVICMARSLGLIKFINVDKL